MSKKVKAVICDNNKYLAAQIGCGQYTDLWEFIGAYLKEGETPEETLKYFAKELLGLEIKVGDLLISYEDKFWTCNIEFYLCEVVSGTLTFNSFLTKDAKWVEKQELQSLFWESQNRVAVDALTNE